MIRYLNYASNNSQPSQYEFNQMIVENNTNIATSVNSNSMCQILPNISAVDGQNVIYTDISCNNPCTFYNSRNESLHKNTNFKSDKIPRKMVSSDIKNISAGNTANYQSTSNAKLSRTYTSMGVHRDSTNSSCSISNSTTIGEHSPVPFEMLDLHLPRMIKYCIAKETFRMWNYYQPTSHNMLGSGGYGAVIEARDVRNGRMVAVKKMKHALNMSNIRYTLRELLLMSHFHHRNICSMVDCMLPRNDEKRNEAIAVCYVMLKMDTTLKHVIRSGGYLCLSRRHRQCIFAQILAGLYHIHSAKVIHRDLKPENILINLKDCFIQITDFGLARCQRKVRTEKHTAFTANAQTLQTNVPSFDISRPPMELFTEYVVTRWYRAPEVMLCPRKYDYQIDIWAVGAIYAEMIIGQPVFLGDNHLEMLNVIFDLCGTPHKGINDMGFRTGCEWISDQQALAWIATMPVRERRDFYEYFVFKTKALKKMKKYDVDERNLRNENAFDRSEIDLIEKMLILDPKLRWSVGQLLNHSNIRCFTDLCSISATECEKFEISDEITDVLKMKTVFEGRQIIFQTLKNLYQKFNH